MSNENRNVAKTGRYKEKRKATKVYVDFYLDDEREVKIFEWLKYQGGDKRTILAALEQAMRGEA